MESSDTAGNEVRLQWKPRYTRDGSAGGGGAEEEESLKMCIQECTAGCYLSNAWKFPDSCQCSYIFFKVITKYGVCVGVFRMAPLSLAGHFEKFVYKMNTGTCIYVCVCIQGDCKVNM